MPRVWGASKVRQQRRLHWAAGAPMIQSQQVYFARFGDRLLCGIWKRLTHWLHCCGYCSVQQFRDLVKGQWRTTGNGTTGKGHGRRRRIRAYPRDASLIACASSSSETCSSSAAGALGLGAGAGAASGFFVSAGFGATQMRLWNVQSETCQ